MTHPCPGAPPGQNSRWREWGLKVSGGALILANCSVPGGKRRSLGPDFALILEVNKVSRQFGYQILSRESTACLTHTQPAWTADIPSLPDIHTSGLTHPATLLTPTPEALGYCALNTAPSPVGSPPDWACSLDSGGLTVSPRPPKNQLVGGGVQRDAITNPKPSSGEGTYPSPGSFDRAPRCLGQCSAKAPGVSSIYLVTRWPPDS